MLVILPDIGSVPIESELGYPATPLRKALLALAAALRRGLGKISLCCLRLKVTFPAAKTGASFFKVSLLHAIGREDKRADKIWLT